MRKLIRTVIGVFAVFIFLVQFSKPAVYAGNPPDAGQSIMQASTGTVTANGQSTFTITITLKDSSGTILTGDTVSLSASDGTAIISPSSATLNSSGQATFTMASNNPGTDTVNVTDSTTSTTITLSGSLTFAPTPTPSLSPTPMGGCYDAAPGGTPQFTSAVSSDAHSVTLSWSAVSAPVTHYLISYGTTAGSYIYGNPNVGNVTSYTVGALTTGKTYYFVVKAINGCMPGSYSNEKSAIAGASSLTPTPTVMNSSTPADDQGATVQDVTDQTPTDTPSPTQGPPITPVPQQGSASPMRIVMYLLGAAVVLIAIAGFIWWKSSRGSVGEPGDPMPPPEFPSSPQQPETSSSDEGDATIPRL